MCETKIKTAVKQILETRFANEPSHKRQLKIYKNRLQFSCPFCGDSDEYNKKRGNLYLDKNFYKCYNAGCPLSYMSTVKFLSKFNELGNFSFEELDQLKKVESTFNSFTNSVGNESLEKISIPRQNLKTLLKLKDFDELKDYDLINFIKNRKLKKFKSKFLFFEPFKQIYVLNTNKTGDKILSFQIRNLNDKYVKYITYNWEKMLEKCGLKQHITFDRKQIDLINQESLKFNILTVNLSKLTFITEGPIDSFFLPNALSPVGIKRMPLLEDLPKPYFIYDNDKTGMDYAQRACKNRKWIFKWDEFLKDKNLPLNLKDINDVFKIKPITQTELLKYFTNDPLDLILL